MHQPRASSPWPATGPGAPGQPVVLHLAGARCLVVGGGRVGSRRARELAASGASVTVVAPDLDPSLEGAERDRGGIELETRPYRPGEASSYHLVVAATGVAEVDRAVVDDALSAGALVSSADRAHPGNLSLPAVHRDGPVTVAVSTGGTSPALAAWLRTRIAAALGPGIATLAELAGEARDALRRTGAPAGALDWESAFEEIAPLVASGRLEEARSLLLARCTDAQGTAAEPGRDAGGPGGAGDDSVGSAT